MIFGKKHIATENLSFSFKREAWNQFRRNKPAWFSFWILMVMVFIGLFASFLANDQPLYVKYKGQSFYPAFSQHWIAQEIFSQSSVDSVQDPHSGRWEIIQYDITDWRAMETEKVFWPLVPFSPSGQDYLNRDFISPGDQQYRRSPDGTVIAAEGKFRHRMGTDLIGRDVLSGLIHGTKISLLVGIISMGIAVLVGLFFGVIAGYYGDHGIRISRAAYWMLFPGIVLGYFYGFTVRSYTISDAFASHPVWGILHFILGGIIMVGCIALMLYGSRFIAFGYFSKTVNLPIDNWISRFIEIFNSMPRLLLIITLSAIVEERSLWLLMVIIGLSSWTEIARFVRAEMLKVRELEYVQAARSLGLSEWNIIVKHALPNAIAPVFVYVAFGIASAILVESGLSFLNIGVPDDVVTWGSMLNAGRLEPEAWWMILYPGLAIFITVTVYNLIGEGLRDALDPRQRGKQ